MTTPSPPSSFPAHPNIRPFDIRRDLTAVADLVELCFAGSLDEDGRRYVRQMRATARSTRLLGWIAATGDSTIMPLNGYVWEENGALVGNLSLLPAAIQGQRTFIIANVAVYPHYRRQGIARNLTHTALSHIERRKIKSSWLQVDQHNSAAIDLYLSLGFLERARRTTWHNRRSAPPTTLTLPPDIKIKRRPAYVWPQQRAWLQQIYPPLISWHLPLNLSLFQAGMVGTATRFVSDRRTRQWAAFRGEQLLGVLSWQNSYAQADRLWLATSPQHEELAVLSLLPHARRKFSMRRRMSLNYPAGRAVDAIQQTGFVNHQTLIWMERPSNL